MEFNRLLGVELRHLAALRAVATERSFVRAAEVLGYTQSAVSQQIATLERLLGERLFERPGGNRPVTLTPAGEILMSHAEAIVARFEAARADFEQLHERRGSQLHLGVFQSVGVRLLPALLAELAALSFQTTVEVTEMADDRALVRLVERGELDLTFAVLPVGDGPFETISVLQDPYVLLLPTHPRFAAWTTGPLALEDVMRLPLISCHRCRSAREVEEFLEMQELEPQIVFRSDDSGTLQGIVAAGVGAAFVPRLAVQPNDDRVVWAAVDPSPPPRTVALAWHADRRIAPEMAAFIDIAKMVGEGFGVQGAADTAGARAAAALHA